MTKISNIVKMLAEGTWEPRGREMWGGAGLRIAEKRPDDEQGDIIVVTRHAAKLSALIRDIRDAAGDWLDYYNKYEFYGKIGEAANEYLKHGDDEKELLLAVAEKAAELENTLGCKAYFAYGSNMDENQMEHRCKEAKLAGTAKLTDYRFALDAHGFATVIPGKGSAVTGLLWNITPNCEESLDGYEGVAKGCYRKEYLPVECGAGTIKALIYISNRAELKGKTSSVYTDRVIAAAEEHDLPESYVDEIKSWTHEAQK